MTIIAKYASRCAACGRSVTPGQKIEWTKGSPVRHTSCEATGAAPAARSRCVISRRRDQDHEDCLSVGPCGPNCEYASLLG